MEQRALGRTGREVSVVGLGTWQLGADWGDVSEADALAVLGASADAGVTFFDTADVYGDGRSEQLVGRFVADHPDAGFTVATKMGRRGEQVPASYVEPSFRAWLDRSRRNLGVDTIDLVQLHCPPSEVIDDDATYDVLDRLVDDGVIADYGVSVETAAQALSAIARPHVASVQVILNAFRMKPLDEVLPAAQAAGVGIIARVPLASGLLSGRYDLDTTLSGTGALKLAQKRRPDLILLDVNLPDMSGIEVLQRLKASPQCSGVPVVMLTGNSERQVVLDCMQAGAISFMVKPVDRVVLTSRLSEFIQAGKDQG